MSSNNIIITEAENIDKSNHILKEIYRKCMFHVERNYISLIGGCKNSSHEISCGFVAATSNEVTLATLL